VLPDLQSDELSVTSITEPRLRYSRALEASDPKVLLRLLSSDVVVRLAVHDHPLEGKGLARVLLPVFVEDFERIRVTDEIVEGRRAAVIFDATVDGRGVEVLTLLHHDDAGLIDEVRIFLRPLGAMAVAAEVVMGHIAARLNSRGPRIAMRAAQAVQRRTSAVRPPGR
jgi:hypothetical protein